MTLRSAMVKVSAILVGALTAAGGRVATLSDAGLQAQESPADAAVTDAAVRRALFTGPRHSYSLYAIRVGQSGPVRSALFVRDALPDRQQPIAFYFWLVTDGATAVLIDTGFVDERKIAGWHVRDHQSPIDGLAALGIVAEQVQDVIITHAHWDHVGGLPWFTNARIWMQRDEYLGARASLQHKDPQVFQALQRAADEGRLHFTKPLQAIRPGIVVVRQGRHTRHFQYVVVAEGADVWVLASDEGPLYENLDRLTASGQSFNENESVATLRTMLALVNGQTEKVVPGHDPLVLSRFRQVRPGIVRLAAGPGENNESGPAMNGSAIPARDWKDPR